MLSAVVDPAVIGELIASMNLPEGWVAAVIDPNRRFVARSRQVPDGAEGLAAPQLQRALEAFERAGGREGSAAAATLEGVGARQYFTRSEYGGWVTAVAVPEDVFSTSSMTVLTLLGSGLLVALLAAAALAWLLFRHFVTPLIQLADVAPRLARGERAIVPRSLHVDEIKRLSSALDKAADEIRERDAARMRFIAMLSHELRNPLATISNASQILRLARDNATLSSDAREAIERQAAHMTTLVNDLLEVSRVTREDFALKLKIVDAADIVGRALQSLRMSGRQGDRRVTTKLENAPVRADPARLEQVVSNLLDNAVKHTASDGEIDVVVKPEGSDAVIRVEDNGSGIESALLPRVFDLFVQGDSGIARSSGGLGIGLALVRRLVELHGGHVSASSAGPGKGACFELSLPLVRLLEPAQGEISASSDEPMR